MQITNHPVTEESIMAYLDGELAPEDAAGMAAHLERCEECRAVAADLQSVSRHLCSWNLDAASLEMSQRLKAELDSREGRRPEPKRN